MDNLSLNASVWSQTQASLLDLPLSLQCSSLQLKTWERLVSFFPFMITALLCPLHPISAVWLELPSCPSLSVWLSCFGLHFPFPWTSLVAQMVKCLSTMRATQVQSLCREDPLEKEMATHSSTLAWNKIWTPDMQQKIQENYPQPSWIPLLCSQAQPRWPGSCLQASFDFRFCTYSSLCLELSALDLPWPAPHPPHHSVYTYTLSFQRGHCWPDSNYHSIPSLASLHSHHRDLNLPDLFIYFLYTSHTHTHTHTHTSIDTN